MRLPKLRKKSSGKYAYAFVRHEGKDLVLGRWKSKEATKAYQRFLAEFEADSTSIEPVYLSITDVAVHYAKFAKGYYRKNGETTSEFISVQIAMRKLRSLYGDVAPQEFGPRSFKVVREQFLTSEVSRSTINRYMLHIVRAFRIAASDELIPAGLYQALKSVEPLRKGRTQAKEPRKIRPAEEAMIEATLPHLPGIVADMVRLQLLTGMRPGELCELRPMDVDRQFEGGVWIYHPASHKNEHHEMNRAVVIGPEGQKVLSPYLLREESTHCFVPTEVLEQVRRNATFERKTPDTYGNSVGSNRKRIPKRQPGSRYTNASYRRAIHRACAKAFPLPLKLEQLDPSDAEVKAFRKANRFSPNQIRKRTALNVRQLGGGLEVAQLVLGHSDKRTTERYYAALEVSSVAIEAIRKFG